jgi:hypothetical protein
MCYRCLWHIRWTTLSSRGTMQTTPFRVGSASSRLRNRISSFIRPPLISATSRLVTLIRAANASSITSAARQSQWYFVRKYGICCMVTTSSLISRSVRGCRRFYNLIGSVINSSEKMKPKSRVGASVIYGHFGRSFVCKCLSSRRFQSKREA